MKEKSVYIFLFNGYSDWEISYAAPEIMNSGKYGIKTFSLDGRNVRSMGGLNINPDMPLHEIDISTVAMLLLPGGNSWEERKLNNIIPLVKTLRNSDIPVAAICGATLFLADIGLLDNIRHTSNAAKYLAGMSPAYKGKDKYQDALAVTDDNIITASGVAPIEFAREIFLKLEIYEPAMVEKWYQLFKYGVQGV
jgi:transcriptional regulator GlxA family with amidase domain